MKFVTITLSRDSSFPVYRHHDVAMGPSRTLVKTAPFVADPTLGSWSKGIESTGRLVPQLAVVEFTPLYDLREGDIRAVSRPLPLS